VLRLLGLPVAAHTLLGHRSSSLSDRIVEAELKSLQCRIARNGNRRRRCSRHGYWKMPASEAARHSGNLRGNLLNANSHQICTLQ